MIYTKTGDKGTTSLANGERLPKTDVRIEAYGTVDELNSWFGLLRSGISANGQQPTANSQLEWIQHRLFNLGAALSEAPGEWITDQDVLQLEHWIDAMQAVLPRQKGFLLPTGSETVCRCHVCRTVCRRAERQMILAKADEVYLRFMNRLSDYCFVLSRWIAVEQNEQESEWKKDFFV
ncbi:MAG: cob(I)yrinic acid a,c-diamide adenosyltransferase [Paludibacteraceae bacterium]|nr:cob(I)yrinic acid a,c-diamide adenosyltransferase [Paludibacteraceae bacterium]